MKRPSVLKKLSRAAKDNGILYMSFKCGAFNDKRSERHYTDLSVRDISWLCTEETGWQMIRVEETCDTIGRETIWLNIFARKQSDW